MRLIDADTLEKDLKSVTLSNGTLVNTNTAIALIEKYPTAYDIDRVVDDLEKELEVGNIAIDYGEFRLFEIVKQGGSRKDVENE